MSDVVEPIEEETEVAPRDFRIRSKPPYPMTDEQRAILLPKEEGLEKKRLALEAKARPQEIVVLAHRIDPEAVIKRTKAGLWSTASAWGKIASILEEMEIPYKVGESQYRTADRVKAITGKIEGKQTARTIDYEFIPGEVKVHHWLDFPWEGYRATLRGTEVFYRGAVYGYKEFIARMIGGQDDGPVLQTE